MKLLFLQSRASVQRLVSCESWKVVIPSALLVDCTGGRASRMSETVALVAVVTTVSTGFRWLR